MTVLWAVQARVVVLGGAFYCNGNVNPAAEANVFGDPEAANVVFSRQAGRQAGAPGIATSLTHRSGGGNLRQRDAGGNIWQLKRWCDAHRR